jgi:hypothetical protein
MKETKPKMTKNHFTTLTTRQMADQMFSTLKRKKNQNIFEQLICSFNNKETPKPLKELLLNMEIPKDDLGFQEHINLKVVNGRYWMFQRTFQATLADT